MKILHVTRENEADRQYGLGRSLMPVIEQLSERGHHVRYLYQEDFDISARLWQQRLQCVLAPLLRGLSGHTGVILLHIWLERLNMGRLAARMAAQEQYDCVHLHDPWLAWGYWLARWFYGHRKARWGVTQHGFGSYTRATQEDGVDYTTSGIRRHHQMEARILSLAHWVICPTESARQQLMRDLQMAVCPFHWQVISHARTERGTLSRAAARAQLGWHEADFHLLAIGRIAPVKRFPLLLDACIQSGRKMHITVLGAGDSAGLWQQLNQVQPHHLTLTTLSTPNVGLYLTAADLYLSTSQNESFGLANVEAQIYGCPAVCSAVGGVPEATRGGVWLVPGNRTSLTIAIQTLYDDRLLRKKWSELGQQCISFMPNPLQVALLYEALYYDQNLAEKPQHAG